MTQFYSRLIAPFLMLVTIIIGGHQGYVSFKDYKKVTDTLAGAKKEKRQSGDEGNMMPLFAPATEQVAANKVINTPLNAEIEGIITSDESWMSFAVIKTASGQQSYREGEKLPGYENAWIEGINKDNVVVNYEGSTQVLALKNPDYFKGVTESEPIKELARKTNVTDFHLSDYLVLKPVISKGHLDGYQITPRNVSPFFNQSGLENGDVVVQVNSVDMTEQAQAKDVIANWAKMQEADIVVRRHAQLTNLKVNVLNK